MSTILTVAPDINYLSIAGGITNLNAGANPNPNSGNVGVQIPSPLILTPQSPISFSSILKICDGTKGISLGGPGALIAQGNEGCLDIANGVSNVLVTATFGTSLTAQGERVTSIKGGCSNIKIVGETVCSGTETDHLLGAWCDESQAIDTHIDYSRTNGRVTIGRGFIWYLIFNRYGISLGSNCKLALWDSFLNWGYVHGKGFYVWFLSVITKSWAIKLDPSY